MHEQHREFEEKQKVNNVKRNPFNAKINQQSLANATKAKEKKERNNYTSGGARDVFDYDDGGMDMLGDNMEAGGDIESKMLLEQ